MQPNARMTFRFDHRPPGERPTAPEGRLSPNPAARPAVPDAPLTAPAEQAAQPAAVIYSGGPLLDDPYTLEDIIRRAEPRGIPATGLERPDFGSESPIGSDTDDFRSIGAMTSWPQSDDVPVGLMPGLTGRRHGPSWWRVFASVAAAVSTGALFGYMVLTLFTGQSPFSPTGGTTGIDKPAQGAAMNGTAVPSMQAGSTGTVDLPSKSPSAGSGTELSAVTDYVLQFGVFRSEESMNAALAELKRRGFPAVADRSDGFRVYAGTAGTKLEAERLAAQLSGLAVYVKASSSDSLTAAQPEGVSGTADFIRQSEQFAKQLSSLSVAALQDEQPRSIDPQTLSSVRETKRRWTETTAAVDRLTGQAQQEAKAIVQALNDAVTALDQYESKISRLNMWNVQGDVTDAVLADRRLRVLLQTGNPA